MHADALAHGANVLVHDDLLATGGTARALCDLVEQLGGRERLAPFDVHALVDYASEQA
jgi:adenine phosphoribosyltransferase